MRVVKINNQNNKSNQRNSLNPKETNVVTSNLQAVAKSYATRTIMCIYAYILLVFACLIIPLSASAARVVIDGQNGVTIDGASYTSRSDDCLLVSNSTNIVIKNSRFVNCYGVGIAVVNSINVKITSNYFENLNAGVYAVDSSSIQVTENKFKNVNKDLRDHARGQFVQFNRVSGADNLIQHNTGINYPKKSNAEEAVNLYQSEGTATSPIIVSDNCFKGGGPSESGGGIMTGDSGGANQFIENNTLVDVGQMGIGVAGGTHIQILNNHIYGHRQSFTNVGIYVWNQSDSSCSNITVQGNYVDFTNKKGEKNPFWDGGNCGEIAGVEDNFFDSNQSSLNCSLNN